MKKGWALSTMGMGGKKEQVDANLSKVLLCWIEMKKNFLYYTVHYRV